MAMLIHRLSILLLTSLLLVGCSNKPVFPEGGQTMSEIYDEHIVEEAHNIETVDQARGELTHHMLNPGTKDLAGYVRDANNEIHALFPQLPNPTMIMFVYPHLAGNGGNPIPGYSTSFPMYERPHFALPGEVARVSLNEY